MYTAAPRTNAQLAHFRRDSRCLLSRYCDGIPAHKIDVNVEIHADQDRLPAATKAIFADCSLMILHSTLGRSARNLISSRDQSGSRWRPH
jgi:hypothetical protein